MDWKTAVEGTLSHWRKLRRDLDRLDTVELLTQINVVNDLCLKAKDEAHGDLPQCKYCLANQQAGGCAEVSLQMSVCAVDGRMDELRQKIDEFIEGLKSLEIPADSEMPSDA